VLGAWVGVALALLAGGLSRFWWPLSVEPWVPMVLLAGLGVLAGLVAGGAWTGLRPREVALVLDRVMETDELFVTALFLEKAPHSWSQQSVLQDLTVRMSDLPPLRGKLPIRLPRRTRWLPLAALVAAAVLLLPQRPGARAVAEPQTAVAEEGARLEERLAELDEEFEVALPTDLETRVEELVRDLRDGDLTDEEARERIDELQEQLEQLQEDLAESRDLLQDLEEAAEELAQDPNAGALADALEDGDMEQAAEAAKGLQEALSDASPEERRQAGEALQRAGERLSQSSDGGLKQAGQRMERAGRQLQGQQGQQAQRSEGSQQGQGSEAGQQGQGSEAGQQGQGSEAGQQEAGQQEAGQQGSGQQTAQGGPGSESGGSDLQGLADELQRQQDLSERLQQDGEQLARSQQLNGALEGSSQRLGGEGAVADGASSQSGAGEGGSGEGELGEGLVATDFGTGHTWEDQGTGGSDVVHHDADRQTTRAGGQELDDFQRLYDPLRLEGAQSLLTSVEGTVDEDGHIDTLPTRLTGGEQDAAAPLITMPDQYREAADQALTGERVPAGYRESVKRYFDAME